MMDIQNLEQNSSAVMQFQSNNEANAATKSLIYFPEDINPYTQEISSTILQQLRPSTIGYLEYRRKANDRLSELNNGMSDLIRNSISGIDTICNKVRECLSEMEHKSLIGSQISCKTFYQLDTNNINGGDAGDVGDIIDETSLASSSVDDAATDLIEEYDSTTSNMDQTICVSNNNNALCRNADLERLKKRENMYKIIEEFTKCYENFDGIVQTIINDVHNKIEKFTASHLSIINSFKATPGSLVKYKGNSKNTEILQIYKTPKPMDSIQTITSNISTSTVFTNPKPKKKPKRVKSKSKSKMIQIQKEPSFQDTIILKNLSKTTSRNSSKNNSRNSSKVEVRNPPTRRSKTFLIPLQPQVYRKRGFADINKILHNQIKANDSLIGFINLMSRKRFYKSAKNSGASIPKSTKSITKSAKDKSRAKVLNKEYSNSLWFSKGSFTRIQSKSANAKTRNHRSSKKGSREGKIKTAPSKSSQNKVRMQSFNNLAESVKCKLHWMRNKIQQQTRKHKYLEYCDILDDISNKDLIPIKAEYPRRDNIGTEFQRLGKSYLYQLVYDKRMSSALKSLLQLPSRMGSRKRKLRQRVRNKLSKGSNSVKSGSTTNTSDIDEPQEHKLMKKHMKTKSLNGDQLNVNKAKPEKQIPPLKISSIRSLIPYMIDPERTDYNQTLLVMPVRVFYDNFNPTYHQGANKSSSPPTRDQKSNIVAKMNNIWKPPVVMRRKSNIEPSKSDWKKPSPVDKTALSHTISIVNRSTNRFQKPDCKLWRTKCGKTPAEQLISFIDSQEIPVKLPSTKGRFHAATHSSLDGGKVSDFVVSRKLHPRSQPKPIAQKTPRKESPGSQRKLDLKAQKASKVLTHLQTIKNRNQIIQDNIQKTINVIEEKMIDILSCPMTSSSGEAFNEMERQISHVLSLMNNNEENKLQNTKFLNSKVQSLEKCPKFANNIANSIIKQRKQKLSKKKDAKEEIVLKRGISSSSDEKCILSSFIAPGQYNVSNKIAGFTKSYFDNKASESKSNTSNSPHGESSAENKSDPFSFEIIKPIDKVQVLLHEDKYSSSPKNKIDADQLKYESPKNPNDESLLSNSELKTKISNCEHRCRLLTLSRHVDKALAKVEDVYRKLNEDKDFDTLEELMDESSEIDCSEKRRLTSNQNIEDSVEDKTSENTIIEPLMKEIRRAQKNREEQKAKLDKIEKTPSCYNILTFLDTLTDRREVPSPIQKATMIYYCRVIYTPKVYAKTTITEWVNYLCSPQACSGNVKKRVSFQLEKIDRNSQADLDIYPMIGIEASNPQENISNKKIDLQRKQPEIGCGEQPPIILDPIPPKSPLLEGFYDKNVMKLVKEETADQKSDSRNFLRYFRIYIKQPSLLKPLSNVDTTVYKKHKLIKKEIKRKCKRVQKRHGLKDEEYSTLLRVFYSIVFVVIFTGFTFNIKCVS